LPQRWNMLMEKTMVFDGKNMVFDGFWMEKTMVFG
jgi:hypothetical protein